MKNNKPMLSVCMIVYNQEHYIQQAIEGVLMQQTDFEIEFVIANDGSTDQTHPIIFNYIANHTRGKIINYINHPKNLGMMPNFIFALQQCQGKYIALCEGDDYWTDPSKLQKQVDFLETNSEYGICFHKVQLLHQSNNQLEDDYMTRNVNDTTTINDLANGNFMHTASVVLLNDFNLPSQFKKSPLGDWPLYMCAINNRKIKKLDDIMAVYRMHKQSVWSNKLENERISNTIKSFKIVLKYTNFSSKTKILLKQKIIYYNSKLPKKKDFFSILLNKIKRVFK